MTREGQNQTFRCLSDNLGDLSKFYFDQSSFVKWTVTPFLISAEETTGLKEKLLLKIDTAQKLKTEIDEEFKSLNRNFLQ